LFLTDISTCIAYPCTRVKEPDTEDWEMLLHLMKNLNIMKELVLTLSADALNILYCYVDSSFTVHADFKSHTESVMSMEIGEITTMSQKGNINVMYCPTDEMIGDFMTKSLQGKKFLKFREAIMGN